MKIVQTGGSQLILADDHLVADFPYDAAQVAEIKAIHGSKWDKVSRVWRIPMESIVQARDFAERHAFHIDPDVLVFNTPASIAGEPPVGRGSVTIDKSKIIFDIPYDQLATSDIKKTVPGSSWDNRRKRFVAPLESVVEALEFAGRFRVEPADELEEIGRAYRDSRARLHSMSSALEPAVEITPWGLAGTLKRYQMAGVEYILESRRCFLADDPGTGKTIMSLAALEEAANRGEAAYPAVVVCPATLVLNWEREASKWLPHRKSTVIRGRKDPGDLEEFDLVVVGWPNLSSHAERLAGRASYILDESHAAKSFEAQRTQAAVRVTRQAPGLVICLTGTPVTNRPAEFASQLEILGRLNEFGGKWGFYKRYCAAYQDRFKQWHIDGASNSEELNDRLRGACYVRRTKDMVMPELDPIEEVVRLVEPDKKVMVEYRRAVDDIADYVAERAYQIAVELGQKPGSAAVIARFKAESNEHLVRLAALRRLAALAKLEAVTQLVEELVDAGRKVVVAAHHRDVVDTLVERFGAVKIQGQMRPEEVEDAKRRFQEDPIERTAVIVLSIMAAKEGHTLTASSDVVFVEEPWTPADVDQVAARCHRLGQRDSVTVWHLLAEGTIDQRTWDLINSKREVVRAVVDGGSTAGPTVTVGAELLLDFFKDDARYRQ